MHEFACQAMRLMALRHASACPSSAYCSRRLAGKLRVAVSYLLAAATFAAAVAPAFLLRRRGFVGRSGALGPNQLHAHQIR